MLPKNKVGMKDELTASPREPLALVLVPRMSQSPSSGACPVHGPHSAQPLHALVEQLSWAHPCTPGGVCPGLALRNVVFYPDSRARFFPNQGVL